jgi:uncharacterized cupin superfamily protein
MKIIPQSQALNVTKPEGTNVSYFLFDEYEVHYNEQIPQTTQTWHHHAHISETIFIIEGELTAKWKENGQVREQIVRAKDVVQSENSPHTFINHTDKIVKFLVIKQVLTGMSKKDILKTDKVLDE